jgi:hypothetical protein
VQPLSALAVHHSAPSLDKVDRAVQMASAELELKLLTLIPTLVQEHVEYLLPRLNQEIQAALRTAVEQALAGQDAPSN